ncbi:MAG: hypothetical protein PHP02_07770 [Eubacteriales bacterium]|nr:hypothetical protein [Eubacteriales bacterium]
MPLFSRKKSGPDLEGLPLEEYLHIAETEEDPVIIHAALVHAEALEPNNLDVQRRLLLLGRLHERNPKRFDFGVIKSYILHAFEHPEVHTEEERVRMVREIFHHERLKRILAMAPDPDAFLREYLQALAQDYIRLFVAGDNSHVPRIFGFTFKGQLSKYLAVPAGDIITNIFSAPELTDEESKALGKAFYRAFYDYTNGEVRELDKNLGPQIRALLR